MKLSAGVWAGTWLVLAGLVLLCAAEEKDARQAASGYIQDFEKTPIGRVPEDLMVLKGAFTVRSDAENRFLELPGEPLDTFLVLFGPDLAGDAECAARILATRVGRRLPEFGLGLGGASGYQLRLMPAVRQLQIVRDERVEAQVPCEWSSGTWTVFRLRLVTLPGGKWRLEGKAWEQGKAEPDDWMVRVEFVESPPRGRAFIFAEPYSGTPVRFDDLAVRTGGMP